MVKQQLIDRALEVFELIKCENIVSNPEIYLLAGGCFYNWMHDEEPNDFDFFPMHAPNIPNIAHSSTINSYIVDWSSKKILQFMKHIISPSPWNIITSFDFAHCQIAVDSKGTLYHGTYTLDYIRDKRLHYMEDTKGSPIDSLKRAIKFRNRGFIGNGGLTVLIRRLNNYVNEKGSSTLLKALLQEPTTYGLRTDLPFCNEDGHRAMSVDRPE